MSNEIVGRGWVFPPRTDARGGIALTNERSELEQSIRIILLTAPGQRVMRPTFGCRIHDLVFDPANNQTFARARRHVEEALAMWEPRISVLEVNVRPEHDGGRVNGDSRLMIDVLYEIKATRDQRSLVHPFYLIPEEVS